MLTHYVNTMCYMCLALPRGVYYGWAALEGDAGVPRKAVLNIGQRPTFADGTGDTVRTVHRTQPHAFCAACCCHCHCHHYVR